MNLYLDTEFNGHGGDLISLALAAPDGKHWYGLVPGNHDLGLSTHPWVAKHVIPQLWACPMTFDPCGADFALFRASLHEYLRFRSGAVIYADWPDDFAHLMRVMSGPSYEQSWIVDIGMQLLAESEPRAEHPHNALSDAIALMEWHVARGR